MLNLTRPNFDKIRGLLLKQQKKVEQNLKDLEKDDPLMDGSAAESSEPGTDSWLADTHSRMVAVKDSLQSMLSNIRKSLTAMKTGKYGKCEVCGKDIESERLEAMPTATLCIADSKKAPKRK